MTHQPSSTHHTINSPKFESSISPHLVIVAVVASAILMLLSSGAFLLPALLLLGGLYLLHRDNQPLNYTQAGARLSRGHVCVALALGVLFIPLPYLVVGILTAIAFLLARKR